MAAAPSRRHHRINMVDIQQSFGSPVAILSSIAKSGAAG
jgi:hypothetical protein